MKGLILIACMIGLAHARSLRAAPTANSTSPTGACDPVRLLADDESVQMVCYSNANELHCFSKLAYCSVIQPGNGSALCSTPSQSQHTYGPLASCENPSHYGNIAETNHGANCLLKLDPCSTDHTSPFPNQGSSGEPVCLPAHSLAFNFLQIDTAAPSPELGSTVAQLLRTLLGMNTIGEKQFAEHRAALVSELKGGHDVTVGAKGARYDASLGLQADLVDSEGC